MHSQTPSIKLTRLERALTIDELRARFFSGEHIKTYPMPHVPGATVYRSSIHILDFWDVVNLVPGYSEAEEWSDGFYREVRNNDQTLSQLSYTEGTFDLVICDSPESYNALIERCIQFYKDH
jgi:hypothetical protein